MSDQVPDAAREQARRELAQTIPGESFDAEGAQEYRKRTATTGCALGAARAEGEPPLIRGERLGPRLAAVGVAWADRDDGPRFIVGDLLGSGATGRVFTVHDQDLDRDLAVKVLSCSATGDRQQIAAFLDEARVTASLAHPNVLPVHEIDVTANGEPFFSMTRIAGATLESALELSTARARDSRIASWNAVASIVIDVGNALAYAHHRGLVHQDVKPGNIMLGDFGEVLLLDWGSATRWANDGAGKLYGTPLYMSPEQARRERSTPQSDVYCLGATLFHALTLRVPTWDDDVDRFWRKKREGVLTAPTATERAAVPAELLSIALKALAPAAKDRYATVDDLVRDLTSWQSGQAVSAHRDSLWRFLRRWYAFNRRAVWVALAAVLIVAALSGELWREKLKERTRWQLISSYDFSAPDAADAVARDWMLKTRTPIAVGPWTKEALDRTGHFRLDGGRLVINGADCFADAALANLPAGDLRVEFDYTPVRIAFSLNCFLCANDRLGGYTFHVGGWAESSLIVLTRGADLERVAAERRYGILRVGRTLHFVVEREGDHVRLTIDGDRIIDFREPDPLIAPPGSGFGFEACLGSENAIAKVQIFHRTPAERSSPLAVGERLFQLGHYQEAAASFAEVQAAFSGTPLGGAAAYRRARSVIAAGDQVEAARLLDAFRASYPGHPDMCGALVARRVLAREAGAEPMLAEIDEALRAFAGDPQLIAVLRDWGDGLAQDYARACVAGPFGDQVPTPAIVERIVSDARRVQAWCQAHGLRFGWGSLGKARPAEMLARLGRSDLVLEISGEDPVSAGNALRDLGRFDDYARRFADDQRQMYIWHLDVGEPRRAFQLTENRWELQAAAADADAPELMVEVAPHEPAVETLALLLCGRFDELVSRHADDDPPRVAEALARMGRYQEVLDHYPGSDPMYLGLRFHALVGLGRLDEAEALAANGASGETGTEAAAELAVARISRGDRASGFRLLERLEALPRLYGEHDACLVRYFVPSLMRAVAGEHVDLRAALQADVLDHRAVAAQTLWHLASYLCGDIDEAAFRAQPYRRHLDQRLALAKAFRTDIEGRRDEALARYREALVSRPGLTFDYAMLLLMRWRIAELSTPR